ncbi:hypothetical protein PMAYCL1PPCAC_14440 [Pristionchus mayeri]|uniref:Uncharacterized protein n=1 Tax=Pristionchus mayeri TaxID=1317129 RepID=A0AAN4ZUJ8_9BILA|nr:hypothetical protein PMAYCL1PPCAC_14440 [Pristionchus mayeri]
MFNVLLQTLEQVAQQPETCEEPACRILLALHYNALLECLLDAAKQLECHLVSLDPSQRAVGGLAAGMLLHGLRVIYEMEPMADYDEEDYREKTFIPILEDIIPIVERTLHLCNPEPTPMLRERSYTF